MLDPIAVLVASPVLVPALGLASVIKWLEDRHSPLIKLERVGRDGTRLDVTKIRSMRPDHDGAAITSGHDDRVTRFGHLLRRYRLDEIPQVIAIINGQMSLIGPRPESPTYVDIDDPRWKQVLSARPAIAGITQVLASRWEEQNLIGDDADELYATVAVPAKLALDQWYVENASLKVDLTVVASIFQSLVLGRDWTPAHDLAKTHVPAAEVLFSDVQ